MDATDIQTHTQRTPPVCTTLETKKHPLKWQNKTKQAQAGRILISASYPQAALVLASLTFGSWGGWNRWVSVCAV